MSSATTLSGGGASPPMSRGARPSRLSRLPTEDNEAMMQMTASAMKDVCHVSGRFSQAVVAFLLMGVGALVWALAVPTPAYAADHQIDSVVINYDMQPSGVLSASAPTRSRRRFTNTARLHRR